MAEAELHVLRARLEGGIRNKAARGQLRRGLPVGLVWGEADGEICFHPDEAVTGVIAAVFGRFAVCGSVRATWLWLRGQGLRWPLQRVAYLRRGSGIPEITWVEPTYHAVHTTLSHPAYAGAYVYGRTRKERYLDPGGVLRQRSRRLLRDQWEVLIPDHHGPLRRVRASRAPGLLRGLRPTRGHQPATGLAPAPGWTPGRQADAGGSHVHELSISQVGAQLYPGSIAMPTPQSFSMASPPSLAHGFGVDPEQHTARDHALLTGPDPPDSSRHFDYGASATDSLSLRPLALLAGPGPSGSTGPPRHCRGCSRPPRRSPAQAAPSFDQAAATTRRWRSFTSTRTTRASWRTPSRNTP
jgi:hypothetical protein